MKLFKKASEAGIINFRFVVKSFSSAMMLLILLMQAGCMTEETYSEPTVSSYQQGRSDLGAISRRSDSGIGMLEPRPERIMPPLETKADPNTGKKNISLSIDDAIVRALSNNPEIRVVSFNPSIAKEEIIKALADFDPTFFGSYNYEKQDNPLNSIFTPGQSTSRLYQTGIKQKNILGTEWSTSYALVRNWDDLTTRTLNSRFEPVAVLQLKQPLLRDGWEEFNRAGIDIANLNHRASLAAFRQSVEDVATRVVTAYWVLLQARRDVQIQQLLLEQTNTTLKRVREREGIDATSAQISQAQTFLQLRESTLIQAKKNLLDVQDALVQLLNDPQINLTGDFEIVPTTQPTMDTAKFEQDAMLREAMINNPRIQQADLGVEVAQINIKVAQNQLLPRLDLVGSVRMQGMDRFYGSANEQIRGAVEGSRYVSWALGVNLEYPLGNRLREAELHKRKLELSKAKTALYATSDEVALQTKEKLRLLERSRQDMGIQKKAVEAAKMYLQGLENLELIRPSLTPEFLLAKLQAQELLAESERAQIKSAAEFNSAIVQLAQATGTVFQVHQIEASVQDIIAH